jgi:hypothetical protein
MLLFRFLSAGGSQARAARPSKRCLVRVAFGTGRFTHLAGQGTWHGKGPSGLCFGTWTASGVKVALVQIGRVCSASFGIQG